MENFLLGLLMLEKKTAYELHVWIRDNYQSIVSHSLGNIQRALKKLHEKGLVDFDEVYEGKVRKKIFFITPAGRKAFLGWLRQPIEMTKAKNVEIGRLLLLGFLPKEEQIAGIDRVLIDLREELAYLQAVDETVKEELRAMDANEFQAWQIFQDENYMKELGEALGAEDLHGVFKDVNAFARLALKHAIDEIRFNLGWFEELRENL